MRFRQAIATLVLAMLPAASAPAQPAFPVSVPVYGNWCGLAYPANPRTAPPPLDPLDAACMRHDYCVAVSGTGNCGCDIAFMTELRTSRWPDPFIRRNARAIYDAIAVLPCNSPSGTAYKYSMFGADIFSDSLSGTPPLAVPDRWQRLFFGN